MRKLLMMLTLLCGGMTSHAQFMPIGLSGFSQDVIAEGGPSSLATTTMEIDALASSNKVVYTTGFASFASITGGLPDNGTLVNGSDTYQLAAANANNALFVKRNQAFELTVTSPAAYSKIRLLCFSAEGASTLSIGLAFTDGSFSPYLNSQSLPDWFVGTSNIVTQGFGRVNRQATGPYTADGISGNNPRFFFIEIALNCTDRTKQLQKIRISNITPGTTSVFPNAVFLAASGISFVQTLTPSITAADCNGPTGSIALTVSGTTAPYTYSWNSSPVQTTATATNLPPGNYTCNVTDAAGCSTLFNATVSLNNNATLTAVATPASICTGSSTLLSVLPGTGLLTDYTWTPGTMTGTSMTVTPTTTTTYLVTGIHANGCSATTQVTVQVQSIPPPPAANPVSVCNGFNATLTVSSPQPALTYRWYNSSTGGTPLIVANSYTVNAVTTTATYYVEALSSAGCVSDTRTPVTITVNPIPPDAQLADTSVCSGTNALLRVRNPVDPAITYRWYSAATGGAPVSTGYTLSLTGVSAPCTWYAEALSLPGCISAARTRMAVSIIAPLSTPVLSLGAVSFSTVSFSWPAVTGATGYLVSTNGGNSYTAPSTGSTGTTHVISGLPGNTTVSLMVKATGVNGCETSLPSNAVSGTTLSTREIFVPNAFTPNGDGLNDVVKVYGNYIRSVDLRIFNQWGQLLFSSADPAIGWDGKHKGQLQPVGVYTYTLKLVRQDGTTVNKKGAINLIH